MGEILNEKKKRILVTSALPYASGRPHIGNLTTLLGADILARYYKIKGYECIFVSGSDEHGSPIQIKAEKEGLTPKEFVDKVFQEMIEELKAIGIEPDSFTRTSSELNHKLTQDLFLKLKENGLIKIKSAKCYYDPKLKKFLADRYVKGTCPYCGAEDQHSDHCDNCGKVLEVGEIKNPYSVLSGSPVEIKEIPHVFFSIEKIKDKVKKYIENELEINEEGIKKYLIEFLEKLTDWDISRNLSWGVKIPLEGFEDQVFYVWFDAPVGYITAVKELGDDYYQKYWIDKETEIIHVIGKDIVYHHGVFWLAMLIGTNYYNIPKKILVHPFVLLEGKKISKSRNWVLYFTDFIKVGIDKDYLRYYLANIYSGSLKDFDISLKELQRKVNDELFADFINLAYRVLKLTEKKLNGTINKGELSEWIVQLFNEKIPKYEEYIEKLNVVEAIKQLLDICYQLNKFINDKRIWELDNPEQELRDLSHGIIWLSILFYPIIPNLSQKILSYFGIDKPSFDIIGKSIEIKLQKVEKIAEKISDDKIEKLRSLLKEEKEEDQCTIEDFLKIKLVVGKVIKAERISEKLLKLEIDIGTEKRIVVAGIGKEYPPEEIINKYVVLVKNLKPKKIKGIESQGMILAAEKDGKISLITVDKEIDPGAEVH